MQLFVGIDLGTSGCRAIAIDESGTIQAQADTTIAPPQRSGVEVEQHPDEWHKALFETLDQLFTLIPSGDVAAIAVDGTSSTLLLANEAGKPLAPALMYNDARASSEAQQVAQYAPRESAAHGATSGLAKLLWLQQQPYAKEAHFLLHQADWANGILTGCYGTSDANNCLKLGYDPIQNCWPTWLDQLPINKEWLPKVVKPGTPLGTVCSAMQQRFKLHESTMVVAGTTDSTAAIIATGASQVGEAVTSLGSTLVLKVVAAQPIFAPEYGVYSQPLGEHWLVGGGSNCGGAVLLQYFTKQQLAEMTDKLRPEQPTGLNYYPLPHPGERFPDCDPDKQPQLTPRPESDLTFFQGMLEGMAAIEQQGYERLQELGCPYPISVRSAGGGSKNGAWTKIRSRLLAVPMLEAAQHEAAYGVALLAKQNRNHSLC